MTKFLGFKQVTLSEYQSLSTESKKFYLWLVREKDAEGNLTGKAQIYFGTRLYAEVNDDSASKEQLNDIIKALGGSVDSEGKFVGFLPMEGHDILGDTGVTNVSQALSALETVILANKDALDGKVSQGDFDALSGRVDTLETTVSGLTENEVEKEDFESVSGKVETIDEQLNGTTGVTSRVDALETELNGVSGITSRVETVEDEMEKKANAEDVYTKAQVDEKVAGLWHFKGKKDTYEELIAITGATEGEVYQVGTAEYGYNGTEWVYLGEKTDLTEVLSGISENKRDIALANSAITELDDTKAEASDVEALQKVSTETVDTYVDAVNGATADNQGKIFIVSNETYSYVDESGNTVYTTDKTEAEAYTGYTTYSAGAYIVSGNGAVSKVGTTSASGDIAGDVATLKGEVATLKNDTTHTIDGDDVEE